MKKTTTASPNPLEAHLGFWLRFVSNHVSGRFEQQLAAYDMSVTEWVALRTLYSQPATTHAALIEALGMTKGATSKVISRLESKGLLARHLAEDSGREQVLELTTAGKRLLPGLANIADDNDQFFFSHLEPARREALMALMQELVIHHKLKAVPVK